jgi:hypothetical protein
VEPWAEQLTRSVDASGPPADAGTLAAIVARRDRLRVRRLERVTAAAIVVGLAVGGTGLGIGLSATGRRGSPPATSALGGVAVHHGAVVVPIERVAAAAPESVPSGGHGADGRLVPLFRRSSGGVEIRAFAEPMPASPVADLPAVVLPVEPPSAGGLPSSCSVLAGAGDLLLDVSDAGAVARQVAAPVAALGTSAVFYAAVEGSREGAPMAVVAARVSAGVARLVARFAGGAVEVARPVEGWAVVAHVVGSPGDPAAGVRRPASGVRVEATSSTGKVLEATTVQLASPMPSRSSCRDASEHATGGSERARAGHG